MTTKYGDLFRKERMKAEKSMGEVARALDVSVTFISDVERGRRPPHTSARILEVARYLGVDPAPLLAAANEDRGEFEVKMKSRNASPKMMQVGAGLMRRWADLTDDQLEQIENILERSSTTEEPED